MCDRNSPIAYFVEYWGPQPSLTVHQSTTNLRRTPVEFSGRWNRGQCDGIYRNGPAPMVAPAICSICSRHTLVSSPPSGSTVTAAFPT